MEQITVKRIIPYFLLMTLVIIGCKEKTQPVNVVRHDTIYHYDTVFVQPEKVERYFLVSYVVGLKNGGRNVEGNEWFSCDGMFRKKQLDSNVYASLPYKKCYYDHVIIKSIFEFDNVDDFLSFEKDYKGDSDPKRQKGCY